MLTLFHITQNEGKFFFHVLARCKTLKKKKKINSYFKIVPFYIFFFTLIFLSDWKKIKSQSL